jgi:hypothetical protein
MPAILTQNMRVVEGDEWHRSRSGRPGSSRPTFEIKRCSEAFQHEGMQALRRFLQCPALQRQRSVAVFQQRGRAKAMTPWPSFGAATSLNAQQKKAQSITLCAFNEN